MKIYGKRQYFPAALDETNSFEAAAKFFRQRVVALIRARVTIVVRVSCSPG
jgi:hypothetical protein